MIQWISATPVATYIELTIPGFACASVALSMETSQWEFLK